MREARASVLLRGLAKQTTQDKSQKTQNKQHNKKYIYIHGNCTGETAANHYIGWTSGDGNCTGEMQLTTSKDEYPGYGN